MNKLIIYLAFLFIGQMSFAQKPITFLGIPVDGTKANMIAELEEKGFTYNSDQDYLIGEYNGYKSYVYVIMNNDKIWRISIADMASFDENSIKIRYNKLYNQLLNCGKYDLYKGTVLSDNDDVAYEISVNNKRYNVTFVPKDITISGVVWYTIGEHAGKYFIMMFYENLDI